MVLNPFENLMPRVKVPVEDRMVEFDSSPSEEDLATCLGFGLIGSSGTSIQECDDLLKVVPNQIPIKGVRIWMYFVLFLIAALMLFFQPVGRLPLGVQIVPWVILTVAGLFVIPTMMTMFSWVNERVGSEPYLIFDRTSGGIELPRLNKSIPQTEASEIVFLDRYVNGLQHWHVALLTRKGEVWNYLHLFNEAGASSGPRIFGSSELYEKIAAELQIDVRKVKFSKKESKNLA